MDMVQQALNTLAHLCSRKPLKTKYPDLPEEIRALDEPSKARAAQEILDVSKYLHTIDLMRWYGKYQNGGEYNKEGLLKIYGKLKEMCTDHANYDEEIKRYPPPASLRKLYNK